MKCPVFVTKKTGRSNVSSNVKRASRFVNEFHILKVSFKLCTTKFTPGLFLIKGSGGGDKGGFSTNCGKSFYLSFLFALDNITNRTTAIMHNVTMPAIVEDIVILGNCSNFNM